MIAHPFILINQNCYKESPKALIKESQYNLNKETKEWNDFSIYSNTKLGFKG